MKYKVVEIVLDNAVTHKYRAVVYEHPSDCEENKTYPNMFGFYYFRPDEMTDNEALEKLKKLLIEKHRSTINQLLQRISSIESLKLPG